MILDYRDRIHLKDSMIIAKDSINSKLKTELKLQDSSNTILINKFQTSEEEKVKVVQHYEKQTKKKNTISLVQKIIIVILTFGLIIK